MRALEFKSKIKGNQISIPSQILPELNSSQDKDVRIIILVDDSDLHDKLIFQQSSRKQFLEGYADTDSIYDNY